MMAWLFDLFYVLLGCLVLFAVGALSFAAGLLIGYEEGKK